MSSLSDYKRTLIIARTQKYNTDLATLLAYYQGLVNIINADSSLARRSKVNKLHMTIRAKNRAVNTLRTRYNSDVYRIKKITVLPPPPEPPLRTIPKKIALLVGINYIGKHNRLYGCINDALLMSNVLKNYYGYNDADITLMTDYTSIKPTCANIIKEFTNLLKYSIPGDSLFFSYSGHGTVRSNNENLNPTDKIDECIYPLDGNIITDVKLKQLIDANMKSGVKLSTVFDSCFSGTILNLKYNYLDSNYNNTTFVDTYQTETAGQVICISSSTGTQTSIDAYLDGKYNGALTWALSTTISSAPVDDPLTWLQLINNVRDILSTNEFTQLTQLSSGNALDLNSVVDF